MQRYIFDAYGTLFDVTCVPESVAAVFGARARAVVEGCRSKQLEYTWVYTLLGTYKDLETLTAEALEFVLAQEAQRQPEMNEALLALYRQPHCYPDVKEALQRMLDLRHPLYILSNGTRSMLDAALEHTGLADCFAEIVSVDEVRTYKPTATAYDVALERLKLEPAAITFVSSNRWDVAGATRRGFRTVWLNRRNGPDEYKDLRPYHTIASLNELAGY